jgi:hypothetical protein
MKRAAAPFEPCYFRPRPYRPEMPGHDGKKEKGGGGLYAIKVMDTAKSKTPQRQAAKDGVLPRFPFSMIISGSSGSGKTNLLLNLLTRDELYGKYFHYILVFSPTAGSTDDTYKALKLPKDNFVRELKAEYLTNIIANRKALIEEKGIEWVVKHSRMCIILDDVIADRGFLQSPEALKLFALLRHYQCAIIMLIQSYNKTPRTLRDNANATIIFPAIRDEVEVLLDEVTPAELTKREFMEVIKYATREQYHFLYINRHAKPGQQMRHNLDEIIDLEKFKQPPHIRASVHDVSTNRRLVEGRGVGPGSGQAGARGPALQSGHSRRRDESPGEQGEGQGARR